MIVIRLFKQYIDNNKFVCYPLWMRKRKRMGNMIWKN